MIEVMLIMVRLGWVICLSWGKGPHVLGNGPHVLGNEQEDYKI